MLTVLQHSYGRWSRSYTSVKKRTCGYAWKQRLAVSTQAQREQPSTGGMAPNSVAKISCSVAVIGAGAAGLAAARELRAEGHQVVVYEQGPGIGGVWAYTPASESDPLGAAPGRARVHSSMYAGLRTNLPRELMAYSDFSFSPSDLGHWSVDDRRFCCHQEVFNYLQAFAEHHDLHSLVQLDTEVVAVRPAPGCNLPSIDQAGSQQQAANASDSAVSGALQWEVETQFSSGTQQADQQAGRQRHVFDAVVVCNGHYSEPNLPQVEGAATFPGLQMHSHNYRQPDGFKGQTVMVVGASNSGEDISREVASTASRVYLAARSWKNPAWAQDMAGSCPRANIYRRPMVAQLSAAGGATFTDGSSVEHVDAVIYCTGYRYRFSFLEGLGLLRTGEQHVEPLWQHMLHPATGARLALLGLPWKVVPFPLAELQSKLLARLLSGRAQLPAPQQMQAEADGFIADLAARGVPLRYAHMMGEQQWAYMEALAALAGPDVAPPEPWRAEMYAKTGSNKRLHPETYRDVWD